MMVWYPAHPDVVCSRCGNSDDLIILTSAGLPYCAECRRCPHGGDIVEMPCSECLRDKHSVWTFSSGPVIVDLPLYLLEAALYGVPHETWNYADSDASIGIYRTVVSRARLMNHEERAEFMQPPYPLLHLMLRRISWRTP
jgi:hypothetical protein